MIRQLKIGQRAVLAFGILGLVTLILGIIAISQFNRTGQVVNTLVDMRVPAAITVGELRRDFLLTRLQTVNAIYAADEQGRNTAINQLTELHNNFNANMQKMAGFVESADGKQLLNQIASSRNEYDAQHARLMEYIRAGDMVQADRFRHQGFNELGFKVTDTLNELGRYQQQRAASAGDDVRGIIATSNTLMITAIIIAVILVVVFAWIFSSSLLKPIKMALTASQTIASGDLTSQFQDENKDEMAEMIRSLAVMQRQLKHTIIAINRHRGDHII